MKKKARKVYFQDFNEETFELVVRPQLELNGLEGGEFEFVSGDWGSMGIGV